MTKEIDPKTGRPFGDHGTANQALKFALEVLKTRKLFFLEEWYEGAAADEFPEFYLWLEGRES
jgi:hypothetical protein